MSVSFFSLSLVFTILPFHTLPYRLSPCYGQPHTFLMERG